MRRLFDAGVILIWCFFHAARAAERVDAKLYLQHVLETRQRRAANLASPRERREATKLPLSDLDELTSLGKDTKLQVTKTATTVQGTQLMRMQETFKGEVVSDAVVTLETDSSGEHVLDASGAFYRHIEQDTDGSSKINETRALRICLRYNYDEGLAGDISHVKTEPEIFIDDNEHAYPGYFVQYLVLLEGEERRPTCLVDARDGSVSVSWDALESCRDCQATGTGGNARIGKIRYGELQRCLDVTRVGDTCYLENKYVRVINNNFTYKEKEEEELPDVASYNCEEIEDEVNGAYSPLLDAFFYGTVVGRMFEDWYGNTPLKDKLLFRVHFGQNFSNAQWTGYECQFGDGYTIMHPLISVDIVGHEVGHGVTEQNSNLFYYKQWGALNEAFSDMMGESTQAYLGEADWVMGVDIMKNDGPPLRYFDNPNKDNRSINHVDNFTDDLDVHLGSGVYNRVFYLLVHEHQVPIKEVFHVFLHANQMYWHHLTNYTSGACDVMKAAYDLGQDGHLFRQAFSDVGIDVCNTDDHVMGLRNDEVYPNITASKSINPTFVFGLPGEFAASVEVEAVSAHGTVIVVLTDKSWDSDDNNFDIYAQNDTYILYNIAGNSSRHLTIRLSTYEVEPFYDVRLLVKYHCLTEIIADGSSIMRFYLWQAYCPEEYAAYEERKQQEEEAKSEKEGEENGENEGEGEEEKEVDVHTGGKFFNFSLSLSIQSNMHRSNSGSRDGQEAGPEQ